MNSLLKDTKESVLTAEESARIKTSPTVQTLVERKKNEIELRKNYINHLLGLLDLHGFKIEREDLTDSGIKPKTSSKTTKTNSSKIDEYINLLKHDEPEKLRAGDYYQHKLLEHMSTLLHIQPNLTGTCDQLDVKNLVEWLQCADIYTSSGAFPIPASKILWEQGCTVDLDTRSQKSILNRILKHFFGMKAEECARRRNNSVRIREYSLSRNE